MLVRTQQYPAQPRQLQAGIELWWKSVDPDLNPRQPPQAKPPLPRNLGLTFFGKLVSNVGTSGIGTGLDPAFQMLQKLGVLADPNFVTSFALTYPQYPEGKIHLSDEAARKAGQLVEEDPAFRRQARVDRLGAGYEAVKRVQPSIIYCSISGYGQDGPLSSASGHEATYMAAVLACGGGALLMGAAAAYLYGLIRDKPPKPVVKTRTERRIDCIETHRTRARQPRGR